MPGLWSINYRQIKTPIVLMVYSLYRVENDLQNVRPALGLTTLLLQFYQAQACRLDSGMTAASPADRSIMIKVNICEHWHVDFLA